MFSGRLDRLEEALGRINRLAEELDVPEQLLPEAQQYARDCAIANAATAAGDPARPSSRREPRGLRRRRPRIRAGHGAGSVMQSWAGRESVRTAPSVLAGREMEVARMADEMWPSVHYRRGELGEAREILRGDINKIVRAVNFDGRKTCSVVWYLTRVLGEESTILASERTPEELRLPETIQRFPDRLIAQPRSRPRSSRASTPASTRSAAPERWAMASSERTWNDPAALQRRGRDTFLSWYKQTPGRRRRRTWSWPNCRSRRGMK